MSLTYTSFKHFQGCLETLLMFHDFLRIFQCSLQIKELTKPTSACLKLTPSTYLFLIFLTYSVNLFPFHGSNMEISGYYCLLICRMCDIVSLEVAGRN